MYTRRTKLRRNSTRKMRGGKKSNSNRKTKTGKKWTTAIDAASHTLEKTGSISAAQKVLKKQALFNARKMFGSIGNL
jgi:hypothetical protein